ncbi:hypothetical protein diail_1551 [Diaporthe ilicicola]|nr:hypothetical protein diail_1551 [Diaporthe ilicicola]
MASPVHVDTSEKADPNLLAPDAATLSHYSDTRENASRLMDDLELLRIERQVSNAEREKDSTSRRRSRSQQHNHHDRHNPEAAPEDAFHTLTEPAQLPQISTEPQPTALGKLFKKLRKFPRVLRYFVYATPVAVILLTPILLDIYAFTGSDNPVGGPGGLKLLWFGIWLEVVWCSLWASRIIVSMLPVLHGLAAKMVGSSNHKKWKDIGRQMEMPTAGFIWMLGLLASFKVITDDHRDPGGNWSDDGSPPYITWIDVVWKVIIAVFVLTASNWVEKILIQWIATSFHTRTYASRIEQNKLEINFLVRLYEFSKDKLAHDDPVWMDSNGGPSGAKTPMKMVQENARQAWSQIGKVAGKMAGDFTGRKVMAAGHPRKVVLELLRSQHSSHTLARLIYRTFVRPGEETITLDDLRQAFSSVEDAETCFGVFDKDLNGDISMEELELVCNEVHLEKKAIAASLKDLDSVIRKLDTVFLFIIFIIAVIVFISILSGSAAAALGTSGTTILGLSWMLQATAQEFLQSIIFVFVKHPFDVGDRVTVYGNTGSLGTGDDYYVQEISLLYTEFKKMEGHIVQAPNSLLNTLFILNQRRSSGLADPIELKLKFGTPSELIEEMKARMLDFVLENKRDYNSKIISEVRTIDEVYSVTLNVIFFHKSNYQNELLRLQRHNKFAAELMRVMTELGIEGPRKMEPGGAQNFPFYLAYPPAYNESAPKENVVRDQRNGSLRTGSGSVHLDDASLRPTSPPSPDVRRRRAESQARAATDRFPDFGDVFEGRKDPAAANLARLQSLREEAASSSQSSGVDRFGRGLSLDRVGTMNSETRERERWPHYRRAGRPTTTTARAGSFVYEPTGQSQFQFPRPGDEFPDLGWVGAAHLLPPAVALVPEERLESERQVRRLLNMSGLGGQHVSEGPGGKMEAVVDADERSRGHAGAVREGDGGGHGALCFESLAAVGPRGRLALGGEHERRGMMEQQKSRVGDVFLVSKLTSRTDAAKEPTGEPTSVPLLTMREHVRERSQSSRGVPSTAALSVMSEPVLAIIETTAAPPPVAPQGEDRLAAHSPLTELPALDSRILNSTRMPLRASPAGQVPELYSDSTALCEEEINPPPVDLPGNERGWTEHVMVSNSGIHNPFELPASEGPRSSLEKGSGSAGPRSEPCASMKMYAKHTAILNAGLKEPTGAKSRGHDRAGLPSQASRIPPRNLLDEAFLRDIVNPAQDQKALVAGTGKPAQMARAGQGIPTHFPSILRPEPLRSGHARLQQTWPGMSAPVSDAAHAVPIRCHKPPDHQDKQQDEADSPHRLRNNPSGCPPCRPHVIRSSHRSPPQTQASGRLGGGGDGGDNRHHRLPSSVNFVTPISHIPKG